MKTQYILHGGVTTKKCQSNDDFFKSFSSLVNKKRIKILLCYWALKKEKRQETFRRDKPKILKHSGEKEIEIEVVQNPKDFDKKINEADVFYIYGGKFDGLKDTIGKINDFKAKIKGKLVIGSSAGSFLLCKYSLNSFNFQKTEINEGLGLLPLNVLCHFDIEKRAEEKVDKILKVAPQLPILTLDEGEFVSFTFP